MGEPMDRSKRVFWQSGTFEQAFPTVESATIASWEDGDGVFTFGVDPALRRTFGNGIPFTGGLEHCRNPRCRRGGYEIDRSLDEMVREGLTEKEFEKRCPGDEGSPKGRRRGDRCRNILHYRLTIKYKQSQENPSARHC
jgi:hypothetical protein